MTDTRPPRLLSIVELGGYPNFVPLYRQLGFEVSVENSMRKALSHVKQAAPEVIVAEFNFNPAFRDRLSSLESLIGAVQRQTATEVIVFYEREHTRQFQQLQSQYAFCAALCYPIDQQRLTDVLKQTAWLAKEQ